MSMFGAYFVKTLLEKEGWPKKSGFFNKLIFDPVLFDITVNQMLLWGVSLGAGRPKLSLQIIAEIHRDKKWDSENPPSIKGVILLARENWRKLPASAPSEIIKPVHFTEYYKKTMPAKALLDKRMNFVLETLFFEAIILGLGNPGTFVDWYNKDRDRRNALIKKYKSDGLEVEGSLPIEEWFNSCENILEDYISRFQLTNEIPKVLLEEAKLLEIYIG